MEVNKTSHKQILKATSIFGAVQVISIIVAVLKSKIVSILIGPNGMGIIGLFDSTLNLVLGTTKLGLDTSAVKEISLSKQGGNSKVFRSVSLLRKLILFTCILGVFIVIISSSFLSRLTFGNYDFTVPIIWLSLALLFKQMTSGELAILQGLRKMSFLASANILGSIFGLIISIPLYYFFQLKAIVPVMILVSLISYIVAKYYTSKLNLKSIRINSRDVFSEGKDMLQLGVVFGIRGLMTVLVTYSLQIIISNYGGVKQVGLFVAGFTILNSYLGLIFNAMQTDYYPRLSAVGSQLKEMNRLVNEQALVALLLVGPIIVGFIAFAPLLIKLLFSKEFLEIVGFVSLGILGLIFKSASWSSGYVVLAKGDSKLFLYTGILFNSLWLLFHVTGYFLFGLFGVGLGYLTYYVVHFFVVNAIVDKAYNIKMSREFYTNFLTVLLLCIVSYILTYIEEEAIKYSLLFVTVVVSVVFTFHRLNKLVNIKSFVLNLFKRRKG